MVDKNKNVLAGLTMAQSLDDQTQSDLAELMRKVKKSGRIKTSPIEIDIRSESIQNPGKFGLRRNTITKKQYGGKVQKMEGGGSALNPDELLKVIEQLKEQGRVAGKGQELSSSQNKKIADSFEANFNKLFGKKYGGLIKKMKLGGLIGGQKKLDKNKDGKISGDDFAMMEMGGKVEEYGHGGSVKGGGECHVVAWAQQSKVAVSKLDRI
jgi:type VI protein secretion system component VasK